MKVTDSFDALLLFFVAAICIAGLAGFVLLFVG